MLWPAQPPSGSEFHNQVVCKRKILFWPVLSSFCWGFWSYLPFVLWGALHKHPVFSPCHSWFFMHWTGSPSAVFIPGYSGLFYLIFHPKWSLLILTALPCTNSSSSLPWNTGVCKEERVHGKRWHEDLNYKISRFHQTPLKSLQGTRKLQVTVELALISQESARKLNSRGLQRTFLP